MCCQRCYGPRLGRLVSVGLVPLRPAALLNREADADRPGTDTGAPPMVAKWRCHGGRAGPTSGSRQVEPLPGEGVVGWPPEHRLIARIQPPAERRRLQDARGVRTCRRSGQRGLQQRIEPSAGTAAPLAHLSLVSQMGRGAGAKGSTRLAHRVAPSVGDGAGGGAARDGPPGLRSVGAPPPRPSPRQHRCASAAPSTRDRTQKSAATGTIAAWSSHVVVVVPALLSTQSRATN